tara:strand:+ start:231 stop:491 length:261 start_codon:yes stop_codon:yes gene_type:complete
MFIIQVTTTKNIELVNVTADMTFEDAIIFADQQANRARGLMCPRTLEITDEAYAYITSTVIGGFVASFIDGEWEVEVTAKELALIA